MLQGIIGYIRSIASTCLMIHTHLSIAMIPERHSSKAPDLVEQTSIAPDITGSGILAMVNSLGSHPSHLDLASVRYVMVDIVEIPRLIKATNLQSLCTHMQNILRLFFIVIILLYRSYSD